VSFILPSIIPATEVLIISAAYTVIRLFRQAELSLTLMVGLVGILAVLILDVAITFAANVTEASKEFIEIGQKTNMKYFRLYLKSCQPLNWNIGGAFLLNKKTFPRIADGIILNILIHLLLVF